MYRPYIFAQIVPPTGTGICLVAIHYLTLNHIAVVNNYKS